MKKHGLAAFVLFFLALGNLTGQYRVELRLEEEVVPVEIKEHVSGRYALFVPNLLECYRRHRDDADLRDLLQYLHNCQRSVFLTEAEVREVLTRLQQHHSKKRKGVKVKLDTPSRQLLARGESFIPQEKRNLYNQAFYRMQVSPEQLAALR